ncbi:unnamed protein product [Strongylus vulgaris]|uniref:Potassium channel domain-containing protein n=1 Tax=Strongylus vulgaris TaxID=40348 RepID=A0A3P7JDF0_STRVU|nr:unnamed protein product [Strongylus vulgaris]
MATVGYGDLVPGTVAGKLVGSGAIVCGVMVLALPITIMVVQFDRALSMVCQQHTTLPLLSSQSQKQITQSRTTHPILPSSY